MNKKILFSVKAAVTAALYAALTFVCAATGLAFGAVQFRFSEALAILPVFSSAAIPGLAIGCVISNIISPVTPLDVVFGAVATLLGAILTRLTRNITFKGFPVLSFLSPIVTNGLIVGAELSFFGTKETSFTLFAVNALSVTFGEAVVMLTLGVMLFTVINKNGSLKAMLSSSANGMSAPRQKSTAALRREKKE